MQNGEFMGRYWTDHDIEELKRLAQGYSPSKIAEMTDRSMRAIMTKANKLKLTLQSRRQLEKPSPRERFLSKDRLVAR
jgi:hypothetical protein